MKMYKICSRLRFGNYTIPPAAHYILYTTHYPDFYGYSQETHQVAPIVDTSRAKAVLSLDVHTYRRGQGKEPAGP